MAEPSAIARRMCGTTERSGISTEQTTNGEQRHDKEREEVSGFKSDLGVMLRSVPRVYFTLTPAVGIQ
jgi:hypothetical protein